MNKPSKFTAPLLIVYSDGTQQNREQRNLFPYDTRAPSLTVMFPVFSVSIQTTAALNSQCWPLHQCTRYFFNLVNVL